MHNRFQIIRADYTLRQSLQSLMDRAIDISFKAQNSIPIILRSVSHQPVNRGMHATAEFDSQCICRQVTMSLNCGLARAVSLPALHDYKFENYDHIYMIASPVLAFYIRFVSDVVQSTCK